MTSEEFGEKRGVGEIELLGDLSDGRLRGAQQLLGFADGEFLDPEIDRLPACAADYL